MFGLKGYLPVLAGHLNTTADVLYERQRKLTRSGLLIGASGRGPGSGVRISPPIVTLMVLAMMATDDLSEIDARAEWLSSQRSDKQRCPLTGASTFSGALELVLASEGIASTVHDVTVRRSTLEGQIMFRPKGRRSLDASYFGRERGAPRQGLQMVVTLPGETVRAISRNLSSIAAGKKLVEGEAK